MQCGNARPTTVSDVVEPTTDIHHDNTATNSAVSRQRVFECKKSKKDLHGLQYYHDTTNFVKCHIRIEHISTLNSGRLSKSPHFFTHPLTHSQAEAKKGHKLLSLNKIPRFSSALNGVRQCNVKCRYYMSVSGRTKEGGKEGGREGGREVKSSQ